MEDHGEPKGNKPPFLRLDEIEEEGKRAVQERARELFAQSMKTGGVIDWHALSRGGPAVYQAVFALTSRRAAKLPPSGVGTKPSLIKAELASTSNTKAKTLAKPAVPRVERNWRDRRTQAIDFRWDAFWAGATINTAISIAAFLVIWWFKI